MLYRDYSWMRNVSNKCVKMNDGVSRCKYSTMQEDILISQFKNTAADLWTKCVKHAMMCHLRKKKNSRGIYSHCCHFGKFVKKAITYPYEIRKLMDGSYHFSRLFKESIRSYHTAFSTTFQGKHSKLSYCFFTSFQLKHSKLSYCIIICIYGCPNNTIWERQTLLLSDSWSNLSLNCA